MNSEIAELEAFFSSATLPEGAVRLNSFTEIVDVGKFVANHLSIVKAHPNDYTYRPYIDRLLELKELIET